MLSWRLMMKSSFLALAVIVMLAVLSVTARTEAVDTAHGEYLMRAAGCETCHTVKGDDAGFLAGGRAIESPYGQFYSSNITPDIETGIGNWSDEDFVHALRHGESPDGTTYYPVFPYVAYSAMRRQDMLDIKAYLFSQPPVRRENRDHEIRFPFSWRFSVYLWRWLFFSSNEVAVEDDFETPESRGRYLVDVLGHCGECHTPRNIVGGLKDGRPFAGTRYGPSGRAVPNITPDRETGIGDWSAADLLFFFKTGMKPDGNDVQGDMREVVESGMRHLNETDMRAIVAYLKSLPSISHAVRLPKKVDSLPAYDEW